MGEPHIYALSDDEVGDDDLSLLSEVPPGGTTPPPATTGVRGRSLKSRPKLAVPTDRMSTDKALEVLRGICLLSQGGQTPVGSDELGTFMNMSSATAPLNNRFFLSVGLVESAGRGLVKPTERALEYQRQCSFGNPDAAHVLSPGLRESWFFDSVVTRLGLGQTSKEMMIQVFAGKAGTDASYTVQLGNLLEWLEVVGLIRIEDGKIQLTDAGPADELDPASSGSDDSAPEATLLASDDEDSPPSTLEDRPPVPRTPSVLSLSVEIRATADDLARLSADQIGALFSGAAQIATVKAALEAD